MEIRIGCGDPDKTPTEGWHQLEHGKCAYVSKQGNNYQIEFFDRGYVTADNFERIGNRSREMAWRVFAEQGHAGPSRPKTPGK